MPTSLLLAKCAMVCSWCGWKEPTIDGSPTSRFICSASQSLSRRSSSGTRFLAVSTARPRALWKLTWFLRDFGYDTELLGRDEIDEKSLIGLHGVVKISHVVVNGTSLLNLDGFAPASQWEELSSASPGNVVAR